MNENEKLQDLEALEDENLSAVAGGRKGGFNDPYAGYPSGLSEGLAPSVVTAVEGIARQCIAESMGRDDCAIYIRNERYYELCCMNEAAGCDYMIDFYYINMVLDRVYCGG